MTDTHLIGLHCKNKPGGYCMGPRSKVLMILYIAIGGSDPMSY